tara:strand:- start:95 stop:484 length:390 start_codon:yes stop_codon:yes gene_type:complete
MNKFYSLIIFSFLFSCNSANKPINLNEINIPKKNYNFGKVVFGDTIRHTFEIKNLSQKKLIINNLAPSCGCTTIGSIDSVAYSNETINITVQYIPEENNISDVKNSIVVEMNTEPPFVIFTLNGENIAN